MWIIVYYIFELVSSLINKKKYEAYTINEKVQTKYILFL